MVLVLQTRKSTTWSLPTTPSSRYAAGKVDHREALHRSLRTVLFAVRSRQVRQEQVQSCLVHLPAPEGLQGHELGEQASVIYPEGHKLLAHEANGRRKTHRNYSAIDSASTRDGENRRARAFRIAVVGSLDESIETLPELFAEKRNAQVAQAKPKKFAIPVDRSISYLSLESWAGDELSFRAGLWLGQGKDRHSFPAFPGFDDDEDFLDQCEAMEVDRPEYPPESRTVKPDFFRLWPGDGARTHSQIAYPRATGVRVIPLLLLHYKETARSPFPSCSSNERSATSPSGGPPSIRAVQFEVKSGAWLGFKADVDQQFLRHNPPAPHCGGSEREHVLQGGDSRRVGSWCGVRTTDSPGPLITCVSCAYAIDDPC